MRLSRILSIRSVVILGLVSLIFTIWSVSSSRYFNSSTNDHKHAKYDVQSMTIEQKTEFIAAVIDALPNATTTTIDALACKHQELELNDPVMMKWFKKEKPYKCVKGQNDLVYVDKGVIRFYPTTTNHTCDMFPLIRGPGDYIFSYGSPVKNIKDKQPLVSDFFKIVCSLGGKTVYDNIHAGVHFNKTIQERIKTVKPPANGLGYSVVMLGFDSMSRMSWLRRMPRTRDFFVNTLGAVELESHNIMGDGTPAALFPMLTGKHENELPEARRKKKDAKTVDNFPWIWRDFRNNGYVTSWGDSEINIAPFNYRLLGFEHSPTDFFLRPFYLAVHPYLNQYSSGCHGSVPKHNVWFNFAKEIMKVYKDDPKFIFHFYATLSHDNNNLITSADEDLRNLLESLHTGGYLDNTIFALFADHGARFSNVRETTSGKLEERLPYFALSFPKSFKEKHADLMENVITNSKRLTSPLDIHETLKDMLRFDGGGMGDVKNRGISLFKEIPKHRTCAHANIAPHWCACLAWKPLDPTSNDGKKALQAAIDTINGYTAGNRDDCAQLQIASVTLANTLKMSDSVLKFQRTTGDRGLNPVLKGNMTVDKVVYQLTFHTSPGGGHFEVTVEHVVKSGKMTVSPKAISRINKYGDDPACVLQKNREIRQYCYCKNIIAKNASITV